MSENGQDINGSICPDEWGYSFRVSTWPVTEEPVPWWDPDTLTPRLPSACHGSPFHQPTGDLQRLLLYLLIVGPEKARHHALKRCATQPEIQRLCQGDGPKEPPYAPEKGKQPASQKENTTRHNRPQRFIIQTLPFHPISQWSAAAPKPKGQWVVCWVEAVEVEVKGFGKGRLEPRQVASAVPQWWEKSPILGDPRRMDG